MTHIGPSLLNSATDRGTVQEEERRTHLPFHVDEVILERLLRDGTLANLQLGRRIIMNIVNAHLVANGKSTQGGICIGQRIIIASRH